MSQFNRDTLVQAALDVAIGKHYTQMTRADIAEYAGCSATLVSHYLGRMCDAREAVIELARKRGCLRMIQAAPVDKVRNSGRNGPVKGAV
jgi:AcrR family transcriptional regulator